MLHWFNWKRESLNPVLPVHLTGLSRGERECVSALVEVEKRLETASLLAKLIQTHSTSVLLKLFSVCSSMSSFIISDVSTLLNIWMQELSLSNPKTLRAGKQNIHLKAHYYEPLIVHTHISAVQSCVAVHSFRTYLSAAAVSN